MYTQHLHFIFIAVRTDTGRMRSPTFKCTPPIGAEFGASGFHAFRELCRCHTEPACKKVEPHSPKRENRHLWTPRNKKNEDEEKTGGQLEKPRHVLRQGI